MLTAPLVAACGLTLLGCASSSTTNCLGFFSLGSYLSLAMIAPFVLPWLLSTRSPVPCAISGIATATVPLLAVQAFSLFQTVKFEWLTTTIFWASWSALGAACGLVFWVIAFAGFGSRQGSTR
jgi:hypothetical protein